MQFDGVVYMNLSRSPDRHVAMELELARVGLQGVRIEGVDAATLPSEDILEYTRKVQAGLGRPWDGVMTLGSAYGLVLSNIKACLYALEQGWERWMLLEDDCLFVENYLEKILDIEKALPEEWSLLTLGSTPSPVDPKLMVSPGLYKMPYKLALSHCHIWNGQQATRAWIDIMSGYDVQTDKKGRIDFTKRYPTFLARPSLAHQNGAVARCKDGKFLGCDPSMGYYTPETRPNA